MAKDLIYYFDKITPSQNYSYRHELGEVQEDFNISFVIDGTKDSARFIVHSYTDYELQPFTILWHENTNSWWIVSHDKVERHMNEEGFFYVHQIDVLGAIELLNARDLTDCGFRSNKYTILQVLGRLFRLSNFEYTYGIVAQDGFDLYQKVDYLKTFENYTLLSAIREFCDGYNIAPKLTFLTSPLGTQTIIVQAILTLYPKVGNYSLDKLDLDDFDLIEETRTIDKNSFGSTVVTNAENVVSTKVSRFPANGVVRLSSNEYKVVDDEGNTETALIRLPTNVYKMNKLIFAASYVHVAVFKNGTQLVQTTLTSNAYDTYAVNNMFTDLNTALSNQGYSALGQYIVTHREEIRPLLQDVMSFDLYDGFLYDAINDKFKYPQNAPSGMKLLQFYNPAANVSRKIILTDKLTRDSLRLPYQGIYWERGSNLIRGFDYFGLQNTISKSIAYTYSRKGNNEVWSYIDGDDTYTIKVGVIGGGYSDPYENINPYTIGFIVEYIPMGDLKIKTENDLGTKDIHLYNQNGKLNDSNSLSKLINSYSKEITTDNITRNMIYYSFSDVPKVGQVVSNHGIDYVINNISLDFAQNEVGYYIAAEITMSKAVAVKSLMVNANSNIRDYGIPQTNTVKRKQVYKDVYMFNYTTKTYLNADIYSALTNYLSFNINAAKSKTYVAFIKTYGTFATYDNNSDYPTGTTNSYYYQLNTISYYLKKQVIVKLDLNDNNVIGYDSQNVASGWSTSNFFYTQTRTINTPVSYTNENGEVERFEIRFLDNDQVTEVYTDYATSHSETEVNLFYGTVFLDTNGDIFNLSNNNYDIRIYESAYNKDALEVPVFEYSCQLVDTNEVLIGDNIFEINQDEDLLTFYLFLNQNNLTLHNAIGRANSVGLNVAYNSTTTVDSTNSCELNINGNDLTITLHGITNYNYSSGSFTYLTSATPISTRDLAVYRYTYKKSTKTLINKEIVLIAKKVPSANISSNQINLKINNYKL